MVKKEVVVISLGGSNIIPDEIDVNFLRKFRELILRYKRKYKFVLIAGGGKTCRKYQQAAAKVVKMSQEDLDWIGIESTRFNAYLVKKIFDVKKEVIKNPTKKIRFDEDILIGSGWKPGCSSDKDAVLIAKNIGAKTVINISNVDYLYDKDPNKFMSAKKIEKINWKGFRKIIGNKWVPGRNVIFDPSAAKLAQKLNLKLILIGNSLVNLRNLLAGKKFKGSVVHDFNKK
jgi:uridylate kinase